MTQGARLGSRDNAEMHDQRASRDGSARSLIVNGWWVWQMKRSCGGHNIPRATPAPESQMG